MRRCHKYLQALGFPMSTSNHGPVRRGFGVSSDGRHKEPVKSFRRKGFDQASVSHITCGLQHVQDLSQVRPMFSYADSRVDRRERTCTSVPGVRVSIGLAVDPHTRTDDRATAAPIATRVLGHHDTEAQKVNS